MGNEALIVWLSGVIASPAILGGLAAGFIEYVPYVGKWFVSLEFEAKRLAMLGICAAIGVLCVAVLYILGYAVDADLIFQMVQAVGIAYISNQVVHGRMVSNSDPAG